MIQCKILYICYLFILLDTVNSKPEGENEPFSRVGKNLLKKIQTTSHEDVPRGAGNRRNIFSNRPTPRVSVLDRARSRQQLLGAKSPNRLSSFEPKRNSLFSPRTQHVGGECQALKTENSLLKQQLLAAQQQQEQGRGLGLEEQEQLQQILSSIQKYSGQAGGSVNQLWQAPGTQGGTEAVASPTLSTVYETTSFVTSTTVTLTRDIDVLFHGKRIPTSILDTEVQVQTVTSTRTIEITPTPSIKPIPTQPTAIPQLPFAPLTNQRQEEERQQADLLDRIHSLGDGRPEQPRSISGSNNLRTFGSFQQYLDKIKNFKNKEPLVTIPSISISTVFLSGSIPGEFSTSLTTITHKLDRRRRQISPSAPHPVTATRLAMFGGDILEDLSDVEILSSFRTDAGIADSDSLEGCIVKTVTVTRSCLP